MIRIVTGDRKSAYAVTDAVYGASSPYVPPLWSDFDRLLDPARNPFVSEGHGRLEVFAALAGEKPVGRIVAAVHDASNRMHRVQRGQFGFFDCQDDAETARLLLSAAEAWVAARGCTSLSGNFNLTAMQQVGVMTGGFDRAPYTDMVYGPAHISRLLALHGYRQCFPMTTFEFDISTAEPLGMLGPKQRAVLDDPEITWAPITRWTFRQRLEEARLVLNDGFALNPMFVPPTQAEYLFQAGDMLWIIDKRISVMAHHRGRPIGAIIIIPDLNPLVKSVGGRFGLSTPWHFLKHRWTNRRAVLIYQSVVRDWHNRGVNGAMLYKAFLALRQAGYEKLGTTWIADVNGPSLRQVEKFGARPLHWLHLFEKDVAAA
jgi:GNAT superfamily N-acetyltransferase